MKRCPGVGLNKTVTAEGAKEFLLKISECGFGEVASGKTKKSVLFRKRLTDNLSSPAKRFVEERSLQSYFSD